MNRKRSLSSHLSRRELESGELVVAGYEILKGSDRVAAIMGGALVETALRRAIKASLQDPDDESALFYDQGAPFGTFHARIVAGKALGLYDAALALDLDLIRDIRNQFAHALLSIDFSNPHIAAACARISDHRQPPQSNDKLSESRHRYQDACLKIHGILMDKAIALLDAYLQSADPPTTDLEDTIAASLQGGSNDVLGDIDPD